MEIMSSFLTWLQILKNDFDSVILLFDVSSGIIIYYCISQGMPQNDEAQFKRKKTNGNLEEKKGKLNISSCKISNTKHMHASHLYY